MSVYLPHSKENGYRNFFNEKKKWIIRKANKSQEVQLSKDLATFLFLSANFVDFIFYHKRQLKNLETKQKNIIQIVGELWFLWFFCFSFTFVIIGK